MSTLEQRVRDQPLLEQFTHWLTQPDSAARTMGLASALEGMSEPTREYIENMLAIVRGEKTP